METLATTVLILAILIGGGVFLTKAWRATNRVKLPPRLSKAESAERKRVESEIERIRRMSVASTKAKATPFAQAVTGSEKSITFEMSDPSPSRASDSLFDIGDSHYLDDFNLNETEGEWGTILRRGRDGRPLTFDYPSRHGEIVSRAIFEWVEYPRHFQGMCSEAGAVICFRKDRVVDWHAGSDALLRAPKGKSRK